MAVDEREHKDLRASILITKPVVYIDMDDVLVNFTKKHVELLHRGFSKSDAFDHPEAYVDLEPLEGAIEAYNKLCEKYEVYILSTASWDNIDSWKEKRIWVEQHLGTVAHKKLILSHNKGLLIGDYLIDDRIANGVSDFKGEHIHFGNKDFPNWKAVINYLMMDKVRLKHVNSNTFEAVEFEYSSFQVHIAESINAQFGYNHNLVTSDDGISLSILAVEPGYRNKYSTEECELGAGKYSISIKPLKNNYGYCSN